VNKPRLIFLCYLNRSGSTYLANLLSKSPNVCVCPESDTLVELFLAKPGKKLHPSAIDTLKRAVKSGPKLSVWGYTEKTINALPSGANNFNSFLYLLTDYQKRTKPGAEILVFKAERLLELYEAYAKLSPPGYDINWLAVVRDVRAVYASQKRTLFPGTQKPMSFSPVATTMHWNKYAVQCLKNIRKQGFLLIRYEDLILNYERTFSSLLKSLHIATFDFVSAKGDLMQRLPESHRKIHTTIDDSPDPASIKRWEKELINYEIAVIQSLSARNLQQFEYPFVTTIDRKLFRLRVFTLKVKYYARFYFRKLLFKFKL
jgi:hypothetical protein